MKKIQLKDFLDYKFLGNVKSSSDEKRIVFQMSTSNIENNTYDNNLYMIYKNECHLLSNSNSDRDFIFLDNETILFQSNRCDKDRELKKESEEITSFYELPLTGGEAIKKFSLPLNVTSIKYLQKDLYLLTANYDEQYSHWGKEEKEVVLRNKKEDSDYEVFTKLPFYMNGAGFCKNSVSRLFIYDASKDELSAITSTDLNVESYEISSDSQKVLVVTSKNIARPSLKKGLSEYDIASKTVKVLIKEKDYFISSAYYFKNKILFIGNKEVSHGENENGRFFLLEEDKISLFYDNEQSLLGCVGSDCRLIHGQSQKFYNNKLYYTSTIAKDALIMSIDVDGNVCEEVHINGSVDCFDIVNDTITFVGMKDNALQEIYQQSNKGIEKLSNVNTSLENKYVADYQSVKFDNDGVTFEGWVLLPKDYDDSKKYPAILDIHGGPKTVYGEVFYHEMQLWANMGYVVFFTNPRGSDGFGNEFMDIFGKYGTIDYSDLMKFCDVVIDKYPCIEQSRIGVTGGSYGGFMTNWIITHTDRFKCAATQRSISNWVSFYGTSDIGYFFVEDQIHGNIYDGVEKLWEHSPLKYVKNIKTPTLFIHSDEDYRCPLEQGLQLYTAMVDQGIDTRFALFHGENHELSRSGKPKHRIKRLEEITAWMEKYLK